MIKIIKGYYGYKKGNSIIPKSSLDAPFECDKAEEARLVKLGVAEYVGKPEEEAGELDKEALIARYKELGLSGNPSNWKAETIAKKIAEAEANLNEGEAEEEAGEAEEEAPSFDEVDGVVE